MLTIRAGSTPHWAPARSRRRCQSSWPGACASVSMRSAAHLERQPQQPLGRVEPFGPGVDLDRHAELGGRPRRPARRRTPTPAALPRAARLHEPARAVAEHVDVRVRDRRRPSAGSSPAGPSAAWSARWRPRRRAAPAARAPGRARRRRGCRPRCRSGSGTAPAASLSSATTSSCSRSRSADSPLATVSRGEWSVSAMYSWPSARGRLGHLLDRRAAVGPVASGCAGRP